ncbi:MAG: hypothetical protein KAH44_22605, partial [Oricola sp.]|nr:hypothetical protein [Oricola sp.]
MSEAKALTVSSDRRVAPIIPQSTDDIRRIADFMERAGSLPRSYGSGADAVAKASIAIMKGLEIGWLPMQAVQNCYIVNGIPTLYGDGAIALARASGLLEYCKEWIAGEEGAEVAYCEVKRRGEAEPVVRTFSKQDALTAGLLGKQGPWKQYPRRMMQMRARAFAIRDVFADVLLGLRIFEEVQDYEMDREPQELKAHPFANTAQITHDKAPESPADEQAPPEDVEAEVVSPDDAEAPEAEREASNVNAESAFINEDDAIRDIERHCKDCDTSG